MFKVYISLLQETLGTVDTDQDGYISIKEYLGMFVPGCKWSLNCMRYIPGRMRQESLVYYAFTEKLKVGIMFSQLSEL